MNQTLTCGVMNQILACDVMNQTVTYYVMNQPFTCDVTNHTFACGVMNLASPWCNFRVWLLLNIKNEQTNKTLLSCSLNSPWSQKCTAASGVDLCIMMVYRPGVTSRLSSALFRTLDPKNRYYTFSAQILAKTIPLMTDHNPEEQTSSGVFINGTSIDPSLLLRTIVVWQLDGKEMDSDPLCFSQKGRRLVWKRVQKSHCSPSNRHLARSFWGAFARWTHQAVLRPCVSFQITVEVRIRGKCH